MSHSQPVRLNLVRIRLLTKFSDTDIIDHIPGPISGLDRKSFAQAKETLAPPDAILRTPPEPDYK